MPANIELPPYDTKGSGTPVTGMMPRHMPMFWKAWKPNQQAMPAAAMRPNTSSVSAEIASARQMHDGEQRDQQPGADAGRAPRRRR